MKSEKEIKAEIERIQTMRHNFERDFRWRNNQFYVVKGLQWVLGVRSSASLETEE